MGGFRSDKSQLPFTRKPSKVRGKMENTDTFKLNTAYILGALYAAFPAQKDFAPYDEACIVNQRLAQMRSQIDTTLEWQRAGAIQGQILDGALESDLDVGGPGGFDVLSDEVTITRFPLEHRVQKFASALRWLADERVIEKVRALGESMAGQYRLTATGLAILERRPADADTSIGQPLAMAVSEGWDLGDHVWLVDRAIQYLAET